MPIRIATPSDLEDWAGLRARLWAETPLAEHEAEARALLAGSPDRCIAFFAIGDGGELQGFAEAALRHDHVNGCETSPVAFLEGIYVRPDVQGTGIGRALLHAVQTWGQARGCSELASDAHLDNLASHRFHRALGFTETDRVVYFRKLL